MNKLVKVFVCSILSLALVACSANEKPPEVDNSNSITFDEGIVYDDPKTYDEGIVTADGAVIENAKFDGNLVIDEAVLDGDVTLRNVTVKGDLIVKGGGQNSIHIEGSQIENIVSNKEGSPVRILTDESSSVKNITMENPTVLEISGKVDTLTVNPKAAGSNVTLDEKSTVKDVTINGKVELKTETPINDLVINAPSTLTINSSVASLQLKEEASDTKVTLGEKSVVSNVVTTVPVEISGTGKVENVVTDKEENMTGEVKGENVEVKENPFNEVKPSATPSATPEVTVKPTVKPTATPSPSVVPTSEPTPKPTPVPTPDTSPWNGTSIDTSWYSSSSINFTLYNGAQLAGLGKLVNEGNDFSGKVINLGANINLNHKEWTEIGIRYARAGTTFDGKDAGEGYKDYWMYHNAFAGTLNGNNYTISGLKSDNTSPTANDGSALFGFVSDATIKNIKFTDFEITGNSRVAVVAAYAIGGSTFDNINLSNGTVSVNDPVTSGNSTSWAAGGIVGQMWNYGSYSVGKQDAIYSFTNCVIEEDVTILGDYNVGGIWGSITETSTKFINSIDARNKTEFPNWKGKDYLFFSGNDSTIYSENCINRGIVKASLGSVGSLQGGQHQLLL